MSYIYSRALVAEYSLANCSDTDVSALLSGSPTPKPCLWHDKTMEHFHHSQYGMTCKPLTEESTEELLTWFVEDSRVKTLVRKGGAMDLMANAQECGEKWRGSFAKYSPMECLWKTHQCSLLGDLEPFSETWPRWGLMRNGECWERPILVDRTSANESGLLPTPMATDWKGGTTAIRKDTGKQRLDQFRDWIKCLHGLTYPIPEHSEAVMGWPIGMTDLKPLETAKYQEWLQQHSPSLVVA